jgi:hypothetical protein
MKTRKRNAQKICNLLGKDDVVDDLLNSLKEKESYHIISVGSKGLENIRHFNVAIAEYNLLLKKDIDSGNIILLGDFFTTHHPLLSLFPKNRFYPFP